MFGNLARAIAAAENDENRDSASQAVETLLLVKDDGAWKIAPQRRDKATVELSLNPGGGRTRKSPTAPGRRGALGALALCADQVEEEPELPDLPDLSLDLLPPDALPELPLDVASERLLASVPEVWLEPLELWPPLDALSWTRRLFCTCLTPEIASAQSSARRFASRLSTVPLSVTSEPLTWTSMFDASIA